MIHSIARLNLAAFAVAFSAAAAFADLTADQVWADWQATAESMGQTMSVGSESRSGRTLTLRDVSVTMDYAEGSANGTIGELAFEETGDGSVRITMSPEIPFDFTVEPAEGGSGSFTMMISHTGLEMVASGSEGDLTYTIAAPLIGVSVDELQAEGEPLQMSVSVEMAGNAGSYRMQGDTARAVESVFSTDAISVNVSGKEPDGGAGMIDLSVSVTGVTSEGRGVLTETTPAMSLGQMVEAGFASQGSIAHGPMVYAMAVRDDDGSDMTVTGTTDSGTFDVSIGPAGLDYGATNAGVQFSVATSAIPLPPVSLSMAESSGRFAVPVMVSEDPQDFAFVVTMRDLVVDETIWSMFDPAGALPRNPATLVIDLAGKANWLVDIFDTATELDGSVIPGQLHALDVNALQLTIAGAELTGDGAFTFDNSDLETFDGMPAPRGTLNLMLTGANGLIDNLVRMGLFPEDQAMGARMMLGLFARPGNGPDELISTIEVQPDGAVLANGQRIR